MSGARKSCYSLCIRAALILSVAMTGAAICFARAHADEANVADYPSTGVTLGQGWVRPAVRATRNVCIEFDEKPGTSGVQDSYFKTVTDHNTLLRALDVSAEAQFKALAFASFRATVRLTESVKFDTNRVAVVAKSSVNFTPTVVAPKQHGAERGIRLTPDYERMAKENPAKFYEECGDSYVAAIHSGFRFVGVLSLTEDSVERQRQLATELEASGFGAGVKASTKNRLEEYSNAKRLEIVTQIQGTTGAPAPTSLEKFYQLAETATTTAKNAPEPYRIELVSYALLSPAIEVRQNLIVSQYWKFRTLWEQMQTIQASPSEWILDEGVTMATLDQMEGELQKKLGALEARATECAAANYIGCQIDAALLTSDYEYRIRMPVRRDSFAEDRQIRTLRQRQQAISGELSRAVTKQSELSKKVFNGNIANSDQISVFCATPLPPMLVALNTHIKEMCDTREETARLTAESQQAQAALTAAYPAMGPALRKAVIDQWVRRAVETRCRDAFLDAGCLNEEQVQQLLVRVPSRWCVDIREGHFGARTRRVCQ